MHLERRRKRSNYKALALRYYLASVARRHRVVAMVIADAAGLLVAGSLTGPEAEELAAVAPLLMRQNEQGQTVADRHRLPMRIDTLDVDLLLASNRRATTAVMSQTSAATGGKLVSALER